MTNEWCKWNVTGLGEGEAHCLGTEGRSAGSYNELDLSVWGGTKWKESMV